ncbi:hypothetical protein [Marivirga sp.]|uniref:hypothetical protein n=1 Tax=Marivirga sp. TaxID=2018662 RepID=UPI002D7E357D|nr:hypothetical protein [Marivirga sp.]HET8859544.1 hypothetical protein [Marivirga sp.]
MLPEELVIATSVCLKKANRNQRKNSLSDVKFVKNDEKHFVDIVVIPLNEHTGDLVDSSLVLYRDHLEKSGDRAHDDFFELDKYARQHIEDLKLELSTVKEELKRSHEDLEESHDNISSYNEELISSNEEL